MLLVRTVEALLLWCILICMRGMQVTIPIAFFDGGLPVLVQGKV